MNKKEEGQILYRNNKRAKMVNETNAERIGWYFAPTDENLIEILRKWIQGDRFPELREVQFLDFQPHQLPELSVLRSIKTWFFLTRCYMDMEINTCTGGEGSWRLFDETYVKNWHATIGMKRHYCFYDSKDSPTSWVAYEYRLFSREISENVQQSHLNNPDEHAVICLFLNGPAYYTKYLTWKDDDIVELLVKRNQGQEFPQFGIVHFFSKEPYQLPVFKPGEKRMYMLRVNDVYSLVDRWATPRGKWKIEDNNNSTTCSPVKNEAETITVGGKRLRKYYDHENKATEWNMYEYYTPDQPYVGTTTRPEFFMVLLFKHESDSSAAEKAPDHITTTQPAGGESSDHHTKHSLT